MTTEFALVFAGLFGACVGSFLNVVIWRLPRGESLSKEASHCPRCGAKIRWYDNVPVLGWLMLRGRCRACRGGISARYPIIEALTALLFVLVARQHDPTHQLGVAIVKSLVLAALVAIAFIDHDERIIPTQIVGPGAMLGLVAALLVDGWAPDTFLPALEKRHLAGLLRGLAGALAGAGTIYAIRVLGRLVWKKEVMGLGDVRLMAMVGAVTGPSETFYVLFLGSLSGALLGGLLVLMRTRAFVAIPLALGPVEGGGTARAGNRTPVPVRVRAPSSARTKRLPSVELQLPADQWVADGTERTITFSFPHEMVWRDGPEPVEVVARLRALALRKPRREGAPGVQRFEVLSSTSPAAEPGAPGEPDEDVIDTYAMYRKAVPFGVFLALGAVLVILYGEAVSRFVTETWPRWITGGKAP